MEFKEYRDEINHILQLTAEEVLLIIIIAEVCGTI